MIWLDAHQLVYQNVLLGNITLKDYADLQKAWKWLPDTAKLSAKPIKCYVYVVRGFDEKRRQWAVMVDTNNNLNFKDETPFYPQEVDFKDRLYRYKDPQPVHYEVYRKGKISLAQVPMVVKKMGNEFLYNFPQYAVTSIQRGDQTYELLISSGFIRPNFERTDIVLGSMTQTTPKIDAQELIEIGENIELGLVTYKNRGVDPFNNWLDLDLVEPHKAPYSLQTGYLFRPLKGTEFSTGRLLSLPSTAGKYVYIDFWGTWCAGCVEEMPALRTLYNELDKTKIEFVGIVCHDSPERLKTYLKKECISWPQILADSTNQLVDSYRIKSYPTSVLIDPQGVIIGKNLRGDALRRKLSDVFHR
ncbi:TlpA family protein disulfide reductase [Spirosoma utsteinense]|uniref:TlpA family protein disulfide reductase n=1 Tax=Spirosoma utsteinense TaxID=2585773 RepID=UPI001645B8C3|nr:TlpA disulfide reductase family protein [Spirosoma utsteinense]MBC3789078.1 thiol-disulfide isomerase/thioredoxin [Spirosoma utsteinense]